MQHELMKPIKYIPDGYRPLFLVETHFPLWIIRFEMRGWKVSDKVKVQWGCCYNLSEDNTEGHVFTYDQSCLIVKLKETNNATY